MPVPVGPGVLYPQPDEVSQGTRDFTQTYDAASGNVPTPVVSQDPAGRFARGQNPASGGTASFKLAPEQYMREPGAYGEV